MRVLIVGAGIAGMTLAALLHRRGEEPVVLERATSSSHAGYMLGLYPLGYRVLHGLGLYEQFADESIECKNYMALDNHGESIAEWSLDPIAGKFGPMWSCTRPQLVELLRKGMGVPVQFERTVSNVDASRIDGVDVTFDDGSEHTFDLVVAADGIGSSVRNMVFGEQPRYDTGWGGWVWWADNGLVPKGTFVEYWGAGRFMGLYPTRSGLGVFAGGAIGADLGDSKGRYARLTAKFEGMGERVQRVLEALPRDDEQLMFFWHLSDVRSHEWIHNRVVLLGDAAAGFLPTAGIGASMAMESAAVLADELSRTHAAFLDHALRLFEKRRRTRVEAIQNDSRNLARLMFVESATVAAMRNVASKFMTLEMAMGSIVKAFEEPI